METRARTGRDDLLDVLIRHGGTLGGSRSLTGTGGRRPGASSEPMDPGDQFVWASQPWRPIGPPTTLPNPEHDSGTFRIRGSTALFDWPRILSTLVFR